MTGEERYEYWLNEKRIEVDGEATIPAELSHTGKMISAVPKWGHGNTGEEVMD